MQTGLMSKNKISIIAAVLCLVCLFSSVFAQSANAEGYNTLKLGSTGKAVLQMRTRLKELGYETGKISSKFDATTFTAVKRFQVANSLNKTGIADSNTQEVLYSDNAIDFNTYSIAVADAQCKTGGSGKYVKILQKRLKKYGYYAGKINGNYGAQTEKSVRIFQIANGLTVTGEADSATRALANGKTAVTYAQYLVANDLNTLSSKVGTIAQVTRYQEQLMQYGYLTATTGVYDAKTIRATKYFQAANGITVTGVAGYDTRVLLKNQTSAPVSYNEYYQTQQFVATKSGSTGLAVEILQTELYNLGYLKSAKFINAKFDSNTVTAVKLFQNFNNMTISGVADINTLDRLYSDSAYTYSQVNGSDTLRKGMSGTAVKNMQSRLKQLSLYDGTINGKYGDKTVLAVKKFQKSIGYTISGIAYTTTLAALLEKVPSVISTNETNEKIEKVIAIAESKLGCKYGHDDGPSIFDCCGFTRYCYSKGAGVTLSWSVANQANYSKGTKIAKLADCKRGDILIFENDKTGNSYSKYSHATLYLGNGVIIHASSSKGKVVETNIKEGYSANYYQKHFIVGVRIFD